MHGHICVYLPRVFVEVSGTVKLKYTNMQIAICSLCDEKGPHTHAHTHPVDMTAGKGGGQWACLCAIAEENHTDACNDNSNGHRHLIRQKHILQMPVHECLFICTSPNSTHGI